VIEDKWLDLLVTHSGSEFTSPLWTEHARQDPPVRIPRPEKRERSVLRLYKLLTRK